MDVTRFGAARPYDAPGHHGMVGLRLQGWEVSETGAFWTGFSQFLPGGGATADATPLEKVYVVIDGELTIITDDGETKLGPLDSCHLDAGERRTIENRSNRTASMLVTMPYPEGRS
jgi:mannose-6-phosphate isomerase-like protein (cupin superfamily)